MDLITHEPRGGPMGAQPQTPDIGSRYRNRHVALKPKFMHPPLFN